MPRPLRMRGILLVSLGLLLLAAALLLTAYNLWEGDKAENTATVILSRLEASLPDPVAVTAPSATETEEAEAESAEEMPTITIDGVAYIGVVEVPSLGLSLPVAASWSYTQLKSSPCRYQGTAAAGNLVLCAHNYQRHFGPLKTLSVGDVVTFTDAEGKVYTYTVAEVTTLSPTAIEEMTSGDWDLTLFTCTLGGRTRVTVRCIASYE